MQVQLNALDDKLEECKTDIYTRLSKGSNRMDTLEETTERIEDKLDVVIAFHNNFEGFFTVMGWIGKLAVWASKITIALVTVWYFLKDHIK